MMFLYGFLSGALVVFLVMLWLLSVVARCVPARGKA